MQGIISIASIMVILSTATVNLHSTWLGRTIYGKLRERSRSSPVPDATSIVQCNLLTVVCDQCSKLYSAAVAADNDFLSNVCFHFLICFFVVTTYSGNCDYCLFILRKVHQCVALQLIPTCCFVHRVMASTIAFFATVRHLRSSNWDCVRVLSCRCVRNHQCSCPTCEHKA